MDFFDLIQRPEVGVCIGSCIYNPQYGFLRGPKGETGPSKPIEQKPIFYKAFDLMLRIRGDNITDLYDAILQSLKIYGDFISVNLSNYITRILKEEHQKDYDEWIAKIEAFRKPIDEKIRELEKLGCYVEEYNINFPDDCIEKEEWYRLETQKTTKRLTISFHEKTQFWSDCQQHKSLCLLMNLL